MHEPKFTTFAASLQLTLRDRKDTIPEQKASDTNTKNILLRYSISIYFYAYHDTFCVFIDYSVYI